MTLAAYNPAPAQLLTKAQYAQATGKNLRTISRYLEDGELPGARKDEKGRWLIPADSERVIAKKTAEVVSMHGRPMTRPRTSEQAGVQGPVLAPTYDMLPAYLPITDQHDAEGRLICPGAATLLGISAYSIRKNREAFGVQPFGPGGSLVVPLATIRKVRGA